MPGVVHFEICADQLERAAKFYENVFGWQIDRETDPEGYLLINTGTEDDPGITGALMGRLDPSDSTVVTLDVTSVNTFARRITEAGGKVIAPKLTLPGLGYVQYCQDSEGNKFAIIQYDESAE